MFLGREWKCQKCGTLNKARYASYDTCRACGHMARSYTNWLRSLFRPYQNTYMVFEVKECYRKGRRKLPNKKVEGLFGNICHRPETGFTIEFEVRKYNGRRLRMRMSFPLIDILPWGKDLYNLIYNPDILLAKLAAREALPAVFNQITSPEAQLVIG